jgi:NADH-quinone oxidoreductase subunit J
MVQYERKSSKGIGVQKHIMAVVPLEMLAFLLFALFTVGASLGVVLARDVWHSALLLGVALLSVAVHYVMLHAEFLAVIQVLVYVGGVLVLVTFAVMLLRRDTDAEHAPGVIR